LAGTLIAFNWREGDGEAASLGTLKMEDLTEMEIPQTEQKVTPPPPPPPPTLEIVADEEVIEEDEIASTEVTQETRIEVPAVVEMEEEVASEPEIFTVVEEMPSFPGGDQELLKFMAENTKYPPLARENGLQGIVVVTFVVDERGKIDKVQVLRGIGGGCDEEAIRVVKAMPQWKSGKQRGMPVRVQYNLPFRFTLR
jgi:protein TonB